MKKNAMLKIAAVLLVAVLLTTCAISSTFAKYATTLGSHTETARVAKWGITAESLVTAEGALFQKSYESGDVVSGNEDNVVAPGTSGMLEVNFVTSGTAEVKSKIVLTDANGGTKFLESSFPEGTVEWSLDGTFTDNQTADTINAEILEFANDNLSDIAAGASAARNETWTIYWRWLYEIDGATTEDQANEDETDTNAGQAQAGVNGKSGNYTATFSIKADIVQVGDNDAN